LYLLTSLQDSPGLGGVYETNRRSGEENPVHGQNTTVNVDKIRGFSSTVCADEALRFLPHHGPRKYGALFFVRLLWEPLVPINGADCRRSALLVHLQTP